MTLELGIVIATLISVIAERAWKERKDRQSSPRATLATLNDVLKTLNATIDRNEQDRVGMEKRRREERERAQKDAEGMEARLKEERSRADNITKQHAEAIAEIAGLKVEIAELSERLDLLTTQRLTGREK